MIAIFTTWYRHVSKKVIHGAGDMARQEELHWFYWDIVQFPAPSSDLTTACTSDLTPAPADLNPLGSLVICIHVNIPPHRHIYIHMTKNKIKPLKCSLSYLCILQQFIAALICIFPWLLHWISVIGLFTIQESPLVEYVFRSLVCLKFRFFKKFYCWHWRVLHIP